MADRFDLGAFHYAHRGLWSPNGPVENSLTAFRAAAEAGFGIELDVRPDRDGVPIVFHDPLLDRLTGETGLVAAREAAGLLQIGLTGSDDTIPSLDDVLEIWPDDLPLLCELKIDGETDAAQFAQTVGARLLDHRGLVAAMSFSEAAFAALPKSMMRGQLIAPASMMGEQAVANLVERSRLAGANYLACHVSDVKLLSKLRTGARPLAVWTVTDRETHDRVLKQADAVIFEHYDPT